jgi:hypothetical protein
MEDSTILNALKAATKKYVFQNFIFSMIIAQPFSTHRPAEEVTPKREPIAIGKASTNLLFDSSKKVEFKVLDDEELNLLIKTLYLKADKKGEDGFYDEAKKYLWACWRAYYLLPFTMMIFFD